MTIREQTAELHRLRRLARLLAFQSGTMFDMRDHPIHEMARAASAEAKAALVKLAAMASADPEQARPKEKAHDRGGRGDKPEA